MTHSNWTQPKLTRTTKVTQWPILNQTKPNPIWPIKTKPDLNWPVLQKWPNKQVYYESLSTRLRV